MGPVTAPANKGPGTARPLRGLVRAISALADARVAAGRGGDGYSSLVEAIRRPAR